MQALTFYRLFLRISQLKCFVQSAWKTDPEQCDQTRSQTLSLTQPLFACPLLQRIYFQTHRVDKSLLRSAALVKGAQKTRCGLTSPFIMSAPANTHFRFSPHFSMSDSTLMPLPNSHLNSNFQLLYTANQGANAAS